MYCRRSLSLWYIRDSVAGHINKGVKKSQRISRMTVDYRSIRKYQQCGIFVKLVGWDGEGNTHVLFVFPSAKAVKKNQVAAWPVSQLSLLFSYKRRVFCCFDSKKCFSKFRKGKLSLCQVIIAFCGYSLLLSSRAGNFPTFLQTHLPLSSPYQWSSFSLDLFSCRESVPKQKVFDVFGYSTKIQAQFYPSKNHFSPNPDDNSS